MALEVPGLGLSLAVGLVEEAVEDEASQFLRFRHPNISLIVLIVFSKHDAKDTSKWIGSYWALASSCERVSRFLKQRRH